MKASAAKEKGAQRSASRLAHRASGPSRSYLKTRIRGSRLLEAAFILAFIELTRRLHQAYQQAYDEQAVDKVLPQNSNGDATVNFTGKSGGEIDTCRPLMANPERWQSYVNDIGFADVGRVAMNPSYHIDTGTQTSQDFLSALQKAGWWWPANRPNLNPEHAGGTNLQREVQSGKWLHITIFPGQTTVTTRFLGIRTGTKTVDDWSKPPRDIQLHCERYWLQPSSNAHLRDFIREKL